MNSVIDFKCGLSMLKRTTGPGCKCKVFSNMENRA